MSILKRKLLSLLPQFIKENFIRQTLSIDYNLPKQYTFRLASSEEDFKNVGELIYKRYRDVGIQCDNKQKERLTIYGALPNCATLMMLKGSKLIGTVTLIGNSTLGLPSMKISHIENLLETRRCAEVSCLAIDKDYKGKYLMYLFKYVYEVSFYLLRVEYLIISTTKKSSISNYLYRPILLFNNSKSNKAMNYKDANGQECTTQLLDVANAKFYYKEVYRGKPRDKNLHYFFMKHKCQGFEMNYKVDIPNPITYEAVFNVILKNQFVKDQLTKDIIKSVISLFNGSPYEKKIFEYFNHNSSIFTKRRHQRFPCFDSAILLIDNHYANCQLLNLSKSGMLIRDKSKTKLYEIGGTYKLLWFKERNILIEKNVRVIWCKNERLGVEFINETDWIT